MKRHELARGAVLPVALALACFAVAAPGSALANEVDCGPLTNGYGPWDYSNAAHREQKLAIVEQYHFTSDVETLKAGNTGALVLDLDYTLRAFPNHSRALWAMARLQLRDGYKPGGRYYTVECYFDRALRWRPEDPAVWLVYGMYLHRKKDTEGAIERYKRALELQPDNLEAHYNLGLVYADRREYAQALDQAKLAYNGGYPLPGLRHILEKNGEWR
jgi:tetratricopeptide (TPR) repeat protein